jgi:hypothetical protein
VLAVRRMPKASGMAPIVELSVGLGG